jgi:spore maturation protein CgeB
LITRYAHATVYASSNARPFELAALGCAMVSIPYLGIQEWFEPGHEVLIVSTADEAIAVYRELLGHQSLRHELGARARSRLLAEHTWNDRVRGLVRFMAIEAKHRSFPVGAS